MQLCESPYLTAIQPDVLTAVSANQLTLLRLPTYASWLNPIEKLWRWLRQDILHDHNDAQSFKRLRKRVAAWLKQFAERSPKLLHYVGILTAEELDSYQY